MRSPRLPLARQGFTLIELSIVLVIIGLIVGGVLAGQDLIRAAGARATIAQIEKYNTAANTFRGKYGYLPGDIPDPAATNFGFQARGAFPGEGDGNGMIEGVVSDSAGPPQQDYGNQMTAGEAPVFWVDLSAAHLVDGSFTAASTHTVPGSAITQATSPGIKDYFPEAKIGRGNFIYVWEGGIGLVANTHGDGINYFGLSAVNEIYLSDPMLSAPALSVQEAYGIDSKMDDGFPQTGNVTAIYNAVSLPAWAAGGGTGASGTGATAGSATTCYDNGNSAGAVQRYSLSQNNGAGVNCALSFRFQ